jgi:hypothetical protein
VFEGFDAIGINAGGKYFLLAHADRLHFFRRQNKKKMLTKVIKINILCNNYINKTLYLSPTGLPQDDPFRLMCDKTLMQRTKKGLQAINIT